MITGSVNLSALKHVIMEVGSSKEKGKKVKGLFLPIDANNLFLSDKGNTYLNIIGFEMKERKFDNTHIVKQSLSKELRESMTDEQKREMPIIGNLNVDNAPAEKSNDVGEGKTFSSEEDVPF